MPVILVVEDEELIQSLVEETLGDGGFAPVISASGDEAVTLLKEHQGKYRALVTDIDLSRLLRPSFSRLFLVFLTAVRRQHRLCFSDR
jgi:CheY-like chemotaxis protein